MKKQHLILLLFLACSTTTINAQFGLKKLKNNLVNNAKNKAIDKAFEKITNLCIGDKVAAELTTISPTDKAFSDYESLKKDIDVLTINIENMELLEIGKNAKQVNKRIKAIRKLTPNANLASECKRITALKSKFKK